MGEKRKEELGERRKGEKSKEGNIGKGRMVATCLVGLYPNRAPDYYDMVKIFQDP